MADEYFSTLAFDHRVMCGFYDHAPIRESYELPSYELPSTEKSDNDVPYFDFDIDDDIII